MRNNRKITNDDPMRSGMREMSLMHVFRDSARRRDAREADRHYADGERDLTLRSQKRRDGTDETALRHNIAQDVASLMNTIRLGVSTDLADTPRVARSIVNFGFQDMDTLWRDHRTPTDMAAAIRETLLANEPRLRPGTIEVRVDEGGPGSDQRLHFEIFAEMISNPSDIPLQFYAEVDPGAGKIALKRMQGDA
ncbi:MAG: type VI secretion system baseplate subunit TssE [Paracoccus sp. (in: a-proteobacteria)]|nr:type VI secretion system baseplate subunit TssE [Paracoccus sp. (in: a-proteobacteria)]